MSRSIDGKTILRAVAFASLLGPLTCSGIHDVELRCEEAVAHLARCCPGFQPEVIRCEIPASCGGSSGARPQLTLEQSACLLDLSCADLGTPREGKESICARASQPTPDPNGMLTLCP